MSDISELAAKQAISDVLDGYCRGLDRMDRDLALATWHEGGTADYGGQLYVGTGAGFVDWVFAQHAALEVHSHQITNRLIVVDGDRAASEAYVTVTLLTKPEGSTMRVITSCGRYVDRWARRDGRWAVAHRQYLNDITVVRQVPVADVLAHGGGQRDAADPSYANFAFEEPLRRP
jgi:SnoaL-like domain